jgi:hypothetical protein
VSARTGGRQQQDQSKEPKAKSISERKPASSIGSMLDHLLFESDEFRWHVPGVGTVTGIDVAFQRRLDPWFVGRKGFVFFEWKALLIDARES